MTFQFYCPQQHLLQAEESQAGQPSTCPVCGTTFVIPALQSAAAPEPSPATPEPAAAAPAPPAAPEPPRVFRIPCPSGHVLETPSNMIGQLALCPYCNSQFELRYEDSEEFKEEQVLNAKRREEELNQLWVKRSIKLVIFVGVMFLLMILYVVIDSMMRSE